MTPLLQHGTNTDVVPVITALVPKLRKITISDIEFLKIGRISPNISWVQHSITGKWFHLRSSSSCQQTWDSEMKDWQKCFGATDIRFCPYVSCQEPCKFIPLWFWGLAWWLQCVILISRFFNHLIWMLPATYKLISYFTSCRCTTSHFAQVYAFMCAGDKETNIDRYYCWCKTKSCCWTTPKDV